MRVSGEKTSAAARPISRDGDERVDGVAPASAAQ
jgi:hypothetical protein